MEVCNLEGLPVNKAEVVKWIVGAISNPEKADFLTAMFAAETYEENDIERHLREKVGIYADAFQEIRTEALKRLLAVDSEWTARLIRNNAWEGHPDALSTRFWRILAQDLNVV